MVQNIKNMHRNDTSALSREQRAKKRAQFQKTQEKRRIVWLYLNPDDSGVLVESGKYHIVNR